MTFLWNEVKWQHSIPFFCLKSEGIMASLSELQTLLTRYESARDNILSAGQSLVESGRTLTLADLKWIDARIVQLESRITIVGNNNRITAHQPVFGGHRG